MNTWQWDYWINSYMHFYGRDYQLAPFKDCTTVILLTNIYRRFTFIISFHSLTV